MKVVAVKNKVSYAEVKRDFVDLLFISLTFPVGSLTKHLGGQSHVGCLDKLYVSVECNSQHCTRHLSTELTATCPSGYRTTIAMDVGNPKQNQVEAFPNLTYLIMDELVVTPFSSGVVVAACWATRELRIRDEVGHGFAGSHPAQVLADF